jgi:hypothetical protein
MPGLAVPVPAIEFNLSSTGMSKGLAQTTGPQLLARGEVAFGALLIGAYAKNVDSTTSDGEAGALVGVRTKQGGFDLAAGAVVKRAVNPAPSTDATALELNASASRKLGRTTIRASAVWSPDDLGSTRHSAFAEAGAAYRLSSTVSASAAFGLRRRAAAADYDAWNAGVTWAPLRALSFDLRYYDTDGGTSQPYRARAVLSARARF